MVRKNRAVRKLLNAGTFKAAVPLSVLFAILPANLVILWMPKILYYAD
jgi:hypothetical protein